MSWVHMGLCRPFLTIAGLTLRLKINLFQPSRPHLACNRAPMTPEHLLLESGNDWPVVPGLQVIILQKGSALTGGSRCYQNAKQHHKLRITVAIDDTRRRLPERCSGCCDLFLARMFRTVQDQINKSCHAHATRTWWGGRY